MTDHRREEWDALLAKVAADAAAEVQGAVVDHAAAMGRSGVVIRLRSQARDLALSAIGEDQIRSLAFETAADDMAWGRPPLTTWGAFSVGGPGAPESARAAIRVRLPAAGKETARAGEQLARDIERRLLSRSDAFDAILGLPAALSACAKVQATLWDDPRIAATPDVRLLMRASIAPLQRRLDALGALPPPRRVESSPPAPAPLRSWRRFLMARR